MTAQLGLDFAATRARDEALNRVERVVSPDFLARASHHVLKTLVLRGPTSGEVLVSMGESDGIRSSDARHWGSVFRRLSHRGWIACTGYCKRAKGHRTAGGRIWSVTAAGRAEVGA
jgi:hypothetical protein